MKHLEAVLSAIRKGESPQWLLLHGDGFQVHTASKAILDLVVPEQDRAFNLERFDGRSTPWQTIDVALRTPPFFPGRKIVLVEEAPYFLSREHRGALGEKTLRLWREGRKEDAGRCFLDLLVLEGWTQERWQELTGPFPPAETGELFGAEETPARDEVEAIVSFCRGRGMSLSAGRMSEGDGLMGLLQQAIPPWAVLMITASQVDRRTRLYKRFEETGVVLDLSLGRDKSGRISREAVAALLDQRLTETGKKIEPKARETILARAGDELWAVYGELEKLFLYVDEEPCIRAKDVEEVFLDQAEAWVFDLTAAIARRDSVPALDQLAHLLSQGEHPLRLLGTLASEVRRLLAVRQLMEGEMRQRWSKGMGYPQFQKSVLQHGAPLVTRNPYGDYLSFQRADNFTTQELLEYLQWIYQADIRLKSAGKSPHLTMDKLVLEMCRDRDAGKK
ncbi:MAG: DNA polymerase III subunit delta [Candidatus Binatia bacterium]